MHLKIYGFIQKVTNTSVPSSHVAHVVPDHWATRDGEWKAVEGATAAEKAAMRFFKVVVEGR